MTEEEIREQAAFLRAGMAIGMLEMKMLPSGDGQARIKNMGFYTVPGEVATAAGQPPQSVDAKELEKKLMERIESITAADKPKPGRPPKTEK